MRKLIYTLVGAIAAIALTSSLAFGANANVHCGTRYTPRCQPPAIHGNTISVKCRAPGSSFKLPNLTFTSVAGLSKITITLTLRSTLRTIYSAKNLGGIRKKVVKGVTVNTAGLASGIHTITIKVVDTRGKSATRTMHFPVCPPPKPKTTG
jgi:hypothetical protein